MLNLSSRTRSCRDPALKFSHPCTVVSTARRTELRKDSLHLRDGDGPCAALVIPCLVFFHSLLVAMRSPFSCACLPHSCAGFVWADALCIRGSDENSGGASGRTCSGKEAMTGLERIRLHTATADASTVAKRLFSQNQHSVQGH